MMAWALSDSRSYLDLCILSSLLSRMKDTYGMLLLLNESFRVVLVVVPGGTLAGWADALTFSTESLLVHHEIIHIQQPSA